MEESPETLAEIIRRAKAGDRKAFDMLYRTYFTPLFRYVFVRLKTREDAEDVVQETFLKAYQALPRYEHSRDTMLPYLFTIARNLLINHTKKKRPETLPSEDIDRYTGSEETSHMSEALELRAELAAVMDVLSDTEREVIELKFFGEQSYTEIAVLLEKREDAVRQHVARAMKKMRSKIEERAGREQRAI
jgi:RNA polymerase sigma-70 factor (ECF subfamily)